MIVDNDAGDIHQEAAALGADAIEGQQRGGGDMQPLRSAADPKAGFIHVLDRRRCDMVSHDIGEALEAPGTVLADPGDTVAVTSFTPRRSAINSTRRFSGNNW